MFAVKVSRYLTHIRRLRDPEEPVARFMAVAEALGPRLGPVLMQLPPNMRADLDALDGTLRRFPSGVRVAVEPRHASWFTPELYALLERRGAALCWADRPRWRPDHVRTADWGYLRLHEGRATPRPCYGRAALAAWAGRIAERFGPGRRRLRLHQQRPGGLRRPGRPGARRARREGGAPPDAGARAAGDPRRLTAPRVGMMRAMADRAMDDDRALARFRRDAMARAGARDVAGLAAAPAVLRLEPDLAGRAAPAARASTADPARPRTRPEVAEALGLGGARLEAMIAALEDDVSPSSGVPPALRPPVPPPA